MQVCDMLHDRALSFPQEADESAIKEVGPGTMGPGAATQPRDHTTPEDRAASRRQMRVSKFSARTPVYQNCKMLSADGSLLCHCDLRKLNWYQVGPTLKLLAPASCSALQRIATSRSLKKCFLAAASQVGPLQQLPALHFATMNVTQSQITQHLGPDPAVMMHKLLQ